MHVFAVFAFLSAQSSFAWDESTLCALALSKRIIGVTVETADPKLKPVAEGARLLGLNSTGGRISPYRAYRIRSSDIGISRLLENALASVVPERVSLRFVDISILSIYALGVSSYLFKIPELSRSELITGAALSVTGGGIFLKILFSRLNNFMQQGDLAAKLRKVMLELNQGVSGLRVIGATGTFWGGEIPKEGSFLFPDLVSDLRSFLDQGHLAKLGWGFIVEQNPHYFTDGDMAERYHYYLIARIDPLVQ